MNFYSRGKFLITGEYLVIDGASALATPLKKGQSLSVFPGSEQGTIQWSSRQYGEEWFSCTLDPSLFEVLESSDDQTAGNLAKFLRSARNLNPDFLKCNYGYHVITDLEFNREWGFGSSSSLISNIAQWAGVDAFELHKLVSSGSGYDVIAAAAQQPIIFTRQENRYTVEQVLFKPEFRKNIWFVYLGNKSDSAENVNKYLDQQKPDQKMISRISQITLELATTDDLEEFVKLIAEHDTLMSEMLNLPRLKETRFTDLDGEIKPMGAWGGDFAMLVWRGSHDEFTSYLKSKNITVFFSFDEIVKTKWN